ncbi:hypothetical protein DFH28DRAFT_939891 [Melampsora americana]|nr:hypothetical protein DFH28DRAFT_939891 [Melampsora americana]
MLAIGEHFEILTMLNCAQCDQKFRKIHQVNEHRRIMHQSVVLVTINGHRQAISRGDDAEFHCPLGDCVYKTPNARYLQDHSSTCKGLGPTGRVQVPTGGDAVLVPVGDEIECNVSFHFMCPVTQNLMCACQQLVTDTLSKYNLAWNSRCRILLCVKCHVGVPVDQGKMLNAHSPSLRSRMSSMNT